MLAWILLLIYECGDFISREPTPQHEHSTIPSCEAWLGYYYLYMNVETLFQENLHHSMSIRLYPHVRLLCMISMDQL